jgi:predicted HTH transcriptional regulator
MSERIFISSVQKELAEERRAIRDYIRGDALFRRFFDVFLFEDLPASDRRADEVYLDEVGRCAIYVGLFGDEYGYEDASGLSPTEREFNQATALGKPRYIYVKGENDNRRHPKMRSLIRRAGSQLIRRRFNGMADLVAALYASLVEHLERTGRLRTRPFDAAACPDATLADIAGDKLKWFLGLAGRERQYPIPADTPAAEALTHLNLLDAGQPSHAAVLLFARQPQRFLLTSEVKCMHFHGTEVGKPIPSYQIYKGTLFELVDQAVDFVMSKITRAVGTRALGPQAPVAYELPREAVAEAIVNAVTHRDYTSNASVQVMLFSDRLELWNPGELPLALTIPQLRRPHASIPRNPLIADPMFLARYAEKAGSGILDMIALCQKAGLRSPEFRQEGGQFIQTLWRPAPQVTPQVPDDKTAQVTAQVENSDNLLWNYALRDIGRVFPAATAQVTAQVAAQVALFCREPRAAREIMEHLQLRHWKTFQANYLTPLLDDRLLERTIPQKPTSRLQKYRLTDKGRAWLASHKPIDGAK